MDVFTGAIDDVPYLAKPPEGERVGAPVWSSPGTSWIPHAVK